MKLFRILFGALAAVSFIAVLCGATHQLAMTAISGLMFLACKEKDEEGKEDK